MADLTPAQVERRLVELERVHTALCAWSTHATEGWEVAEIRAWLHHAQPRRYMELTDAEIIDAGIPHYVDG